MTYFVVKGPKDNKVAVLTAKDLGKTGLQQLLLESAEPSIDVVKSSYPEGIYRFWAKTYSGEWLYGESTLTHELLPAPEFFPSDPETDGELFPETIEVTWGSVAGAASYRVEIEQDDLGVSLATTLPPDSTSFIVPAGFLKPGEEYDIGVTAVTESGNASVAEGSFVTKE
jgi:hypothetical protein